MRRKKINNNTNARAEKKPAKRRSRNMEFAFITYGFLILFLALTGYFVYFVGFAAEDFINNPYNPRLSQLSATTIRGDIMASDGTVLATSDIKDDGTEVRKYPKGREYAHVVGFNSNGMSGVELDLNFNLLRSHSFILKKLANELQNKKNQGDSVVLTIDPKLQDAAYNGMGSYQGAVIAIEPDTGKILCMVSKPDFDPNDVAGNWSAYSDSGSSVLVNRTTQGLYPPGSTFKIITALEYLKEGGTLEDAYLCNGSYTYEDTTIHCYHNAYHGSQTFEQAFGNSCNSAFAEIGLDLSVKKTSKLAARLLFNKALPTELSNVKKSSFALKNKKNSGLTMRTMIGQGDTVVTPIHMAMIAATIENDGLLYIPSVVDHTQNDNADTVKKYEPEEYGNLLTEKESGNLRTLMRYVVTNGTGRKLNTESYEAFGKTGTAEFSANKNEAHSWFVGFAERDDKRIAIAVIMEGAGSGSEHAVPLAGQVFGAYFN